MGISVGWDAGDYVTAYADLAKPNGSGSSRRSEYRPGPCRHDLSQIHASTCRPTRYSGRGQQEANLSYSVGLIEPVIFLPALGFPYIEGKARSRGFKRG